MTLKRFHKTEADIPAEVRGLYVAKDGGFILDAEGHVDKAAHDEMRANNVALQKQVNDLMARYEGIDPEAVKALAAEKAALEEKALLKAGEVDKVLTTRLGAVKAEFDKQTAALKAERDAATASLTAVLIDRGVIEAGSKRGLRATAIPDITARARGALRLLDGKPVVMEADGQTVRRGADAMTPMTLEEWVTAVAAEAPHLFDENAGGGAAGNASGGGGNGSAKNPFRKETWNFTEQIEITAKNPTLAAALRSAA
jgi:hypothetical protein